LDILITLVDSAVYTWSFDVCWSHVVYIFR